MTDPRTPARAETTRVVHVNDNVAGAIYIGRAMPRQRLKASPFANPFKVKDGDRKTAITRYEEHLVKHPELWAKLPGLRGKPLACWCRRNGEPRTTANLCHGDVLIRLLEYHTDDELRGLGQEVIMSAAV